MARDLLIGLYLLLFKGLFNLCKIFPTKDKVTFVVSFGENSLNVYEEMKKQHITSEIVFLKKSSCSYDLETLTDAKVLQFETRNIMDLVGSIYHLATSKHILVDNYYGFLASIEFKEDVQCIQLWHAAGALKSFGLQDRSAKKRSSNAQNRFLNVYNKFDKVVVGSDEMAKIFLEAFALSSQAVLRTGVPRTDLFYNQELQSEIIETLYKENPILKMKKVILYAPTYRDNELDNFSLMLDLTKMHAELSEEYVLLIKLHPAIKNKAKQYEEEYPDFVYDYSSFNTINYLLLITDILITDYSSIPYEYCLLNKPMVFFAYDIDTYQRTRGLPEDYHKQLPGPLVFNTTDVIDTIKHNRFDLSLVEEFSKKWNRYSTGSSSKNLIQFLYNEQEENQPILEQQKQQQQVL